MTKVSAFLRHETAKPRRPVGEVDMRVGKSEQSWRAVEDVSNSFTRVVNNRAGPQGGRTGQVSRGHFHGLTWVFSVRSPNCESKNLLDAAC